jgi:hypothetical protein
MIKWIKKRVDDFVWWVTDDMNIFYVILVLVVLLWIGTAIYILTTDGSVSRVHRYDNR